MVAHILVLADHIHPEVVHNLAVHTHEEVDSLEADNRRLEAVGSHKAVVLHMQEVEVHSLAEGRSLAEEGRSPAEEERRSLAEEACHSHSRGPAACGYDSCCG